MNGTRRCGSAVHIAAAPPTLLSTSTPGFLRTRRSRRRLSHSTRRRQSRRTRESVSSTKHILSQPRGFLQARKSEHLDNYASPRPRRRGPGPRSISLAHGNNQRHQPPQRRRHRLGSRPLMKRRPTTDRPPRGRAGRRWDRRQSAAHHVGGAFINAEITAFLPWKLRSGRVISAVPYLSPRLTSGDQREAVIRAGRKDELPNFNKKIPQLYPQPDHHPGLRPHATRDRAGTRTPRPPGPAHGRGGMARAIAKASSRWDHRSRSRVCACRAIMRGDLAHPGRRAVLSRCCSHRRKTRSSLALFSRLHRHLSGHRGIRDRRRPSAVGRDV